MDKLDSLGPGVPVAQVAADGPVGADKPGNHKQGGNVMRKDGSVRDFMDPQYSDYVGQLQP